MKVDLSKKVYVFSSSGKQVMELAEAISLHPVIRKELYWGLFSGVAQSLTFPKYFGNEDLRIQFVDKVPY